MSPKESNIINVSDSVVIEKPVEEMFAFAVDKHNVPKWQEAVSSVDVPHGPVNKGTRFVNVHKFMGKKMKIPFEVLDVITNSSLKLKSTDGPVKIQVSIDFEPAKPGTKMTTSLQAEVGGFFNKETNADGRKKVPN